MKRALFVACASALLASCSLLGLDDYDVYACDPGTRCDHLNEELGDECFQYACSASGRGCELQPYDHDYDGHPSRELCEGEDDLPELDCDDGKKARMPGLAEACDGIDNDCDSFIDEGSEPGASVPVDTAELGEGVAQLSLAASGDEAPLLAITRFDGDNFTTSSARILDDDVTDVQPFAFNADASTNVCAGAESPTTCRIGQLALGASGDTLLGVGVQRAGCAAGQLRAGAGSIDDAALVLGVPPAMTNIDYGIDVDPDDQRCTRSGTCVGVAEPTIGVLGRAGSHAEQALAAWLTPSADGCDEACGCPDAFQVMAIALFASPDGRERYVSGSDDGHATPIGGGDTTGAPAVVAFESSERDSGYFLAYPAGDRVALRFIPRLANRELTTIDQPEAEIEAEGARHVAWPERLLTTGDPKAPQGLALAFVDEEGNALRFAVLELDADEASLNVVGEPITIASGAEIPARPSLLYAPDGFVDDDASGPHGGWLVLWLEADDDERVLRGVRIAESDLRVLGEPIELARGAVDHPFTFLKQAAGKRSLLRYGFVRNDTLRVTRITCDMGN